MKKKLLVVYVFIALVLLCTNVYAVVKVNIGLTADKTSVKPGEELTVTVNVKDISKAISSIEGYINIDENVLKDINKDTIVTNDGKIEVKSGNTITNKLSYAFNPTKTNADCDVVFNTNKDNIDNNDCFFVMDFSKDIEGSADILKLKFQVKESASIKEIKDAVKIDFESIYLADSEKAEPVSATLDINVVKAETNNPSEDNKDDNNNNNDNKDDNKNDNNNNNNDNKDDNKNDNNSNNNNNNNDNKDDNKNDNKNDNNNNNDKKDENKNTNTNTNKNTNTNTNKNTTGNRVVNNTNTDGTVAGTKIPAAGASMIMLPIIAFAIIGYISYNKYIKYKGI